MFNVVYLIVLLVLLSSYFCWPECNKQLISIHEKYSIIDIIYNNKQPVYDEIILHGTSILLNEWTFVNLKRINAINYICDS